MGKIATFASANRNAMPLAKVGRQVDERVALFSKYKWGILLHQHDQNDHWQQEL
ncbi:MAG TPA: hypothetical protein VMU30_03755 [Bacteroidota bacterium]|nr:hypothetical protein [Bacteroidota bacterium]